MKSFGSTSGDSWAVSSIPRPEKLLDLFISNGGRSGKCGLSDFGLILDFLAIKFLPFSEKISFTILHFALRFSKMCFLRKVDGSFKFYEAKPLLYLVD